MKKRLLATLLCLCMVAVLLPTTALAADESGIQLRTSGLGTDDTVYFGTYGTTEVPWYVLNESGFLLSKYTIGTSIFREWEDWGYYGQNTAGEANSGSLLKATMDGLYNGSGTLFSGLEQGAITETTLTGDSMFSGMSNVTAHLFPLSYDEAYALTWGSDKLIAKSITAPEGSAGWWWLGSSDDHDDAVCVSEDGYDRIGNLVYDLGVRPAFNLNLNSVLFTSAAVGGKSSGAVGAAALNSNSTPSGTTEWKLTLEDTTRRFAAATTAYDSASQIVTVAYSGATPYNATTAPNEYISAIIKDASGVVKYYGRIAQPTAADGTLTIDLSGVTMDTTDTLQVFSEQYNGDKKTDYASALVDVPLTLNAYAITNTLTNIASSNAATYRLMTDTTNNYTATLSVSGSYTLPTAITVKVGVAELANTAYTYSNGSLSIPAASITGDIEIIAAGVANTYTITADPASLAFGTKTAGYSTAPTAQEVVIENTGNQSVTVDIPTSASGNYSITAGDGFSGSTATLAASGGTAKFTVQPITGLGIGTYNETINISGTGGASATVDVSFTVQSGGGSDDPDPTYYYTLTFDTNGGSGISSIRRAEYTTIDLAGYKPTREGFEFTGWYSDKDLTAKITSIRLTRNTTIYAGWEDKTNPNTGIDNPFTDVSENDWFFDDVMFVFANKLMIGTSDNMFSPYDTTTRAMVATTIWRMEGQPDPAGANGFTDVQSGKWYTDPITWAAESGITEGYGGGLFGTNDPVTREQLAGFFYNYAKYKGYDTKVTGDISRFADNGDISDWAVDAMKWAIGYGLIEGKPGNLLDPQGEATRAEFAAMLHRFIEKNELVEGVTTTGLMGWIDPKRLMPPQTGDATSGTWPFIMLASGLMLCAGTVLLKRRRSEGGAATPILP